MIAARQTVTMSKDMRRCCVALRSLLKNYNNPSCGGADALTSLLLPYRSLRICSVVAPRHRIRRAHNLNCCSFSIDSLAEKDRLVYPGFLASDRKIARDRDTVEFPS